MTRPHHQWRIILRAAALVATVIAIGSGALTASAATARPAATAAHSSHPILRLTTIRIKVSTLSPSLRARLGKTATSPDDSVNAFEVSNLAAGLCLDANNAGSTAGQNGDKVQLWQCNNTDNQYWLPLTWGTYKGITWQELVNVEYESMCLNANDAWPPAGGLGNGSPVQLWNCDVGTSNEAWGFDLWLTEPAGGTIQLLGGGEDLFLDATDPGLGNGDQVQIWQLTARNNQWWDKYSSIST